MTAVQRWAAAVYGAELTGRVMQSQVVVSAAAQRDLAHRFAFVPVTKAAGPLLAVAIDRAGAARYAAIRLRQPTENLLQAADLFLKLMSEQPANLLWNDLQEALLQASGPEHALTHADPAAASEAIAQDVRVAQIAIATAAEGGEDGWLLEGGEEPPEVQLYFDLKQLEELAGKLRAKARAKSSGYDACGREMLRTRIRQSSIRLDAVLDSLVMSVGEASRLNVGDVLPLLPDESGQLRLCAETMTGQAEIAIGEMGNWKGQRALKLRSPVDEGFLRELAEN